VADFAFCLEILASHLYHKEADPDSNPLDTTDCRGFSFASQFLGLAAEMYFLMLSVDLLLSVTNPFTNYKWNMWMYHAVALSVSAVSVRTRPPCDQAELAIAVSGRARQR
jgi:hypothetical protein